MVSKTNTLSVEAFKNLNKVVGKKGRVIVDEKQLQKALAQSAKAPGIFFPEKPVVMGQKVQINHKPMSANSAWKGRRFKSDEYKEYEVRLLAVLPSIDLPKPPFKISYEFGLSNKANDVDNSIKQIQDILQKRYGFDDKLIYELNARKIITQKGDEFFTFKIEHLNN